MAKKKLYWKTGTGRLAPVGEPDKNRKHKYGKEWLQEKATGESDDPWNSCAGTMTTEEMLMS